MVSTRAILWASDGRTVTDFGGLGLADTVSTEHSGFAILGQRPGFAGLFGE